LAYQGDICDGIQVSVEHGAQFTRRHVFDRMPIHFDDAVAWNNVVIPRRSLAHAMQVRIV
jgi:acyl dehydratase